MTDSNLNDTKVLEKAKLFAKRVRAKDAKYLRKQNAEQRKWHKEHKQSFEPKELNTFGGVYELNEDGDFHYTQSNVILYAPKVATGDFEPGYYDVKTSQIIDQEVMYPGTSRLIKGPNDFYETDLVGYIPVKDLLAAISPLQKACDKPKLTKVTVTSKAIKVTARHKDALAANDEVSASIHDAYGEFNATHFGIDLDYLYHTLSFLKAVGATYVPLYQQDLSAVSILYFCYDKVMIAIAPIRIREPENYS